MVGKGGQESGWHEATENFGNRARDSGDGGPAKFGISKSWVFNQEQSLHFSRPWQWVRATSSSCRVHILPIVSTPNSLIVPNICFRFGSLPSPWFPDRTVGGKGEGQVCRCGKEKGVGRLREKLLTDSNSGGAEGLKVCPVFFFF